MPTQSKTPTIRHLLQAELSQARGMIEKLEVRLQAHEADLVQARLWAAQRLDQLGKLTELLHAAVEERERMRADRDAAEAVVAAVDATQGAARAVLDTVRARAGRR